MDAVIRIDNRKESPLIAFKCEAFFFDVFGENIGHKSIRNEELFIRPFEIGYTTISHLNPKVRAIELHNAVAAFDNHMVIRDYDDVYPVLDRPVNVSARPAYRPDPYASSTDDNNESYTSEANPEGTSGWRRMAREAGVDDSHYNGKYYKKDYTNE